MTRSGQVGGRDAVLDAPVNDVQHLIALAAGQTRVEEWIKPVQRKVQRMQDQVGGFVIGVAAAVTEKKPGLIEAAHRETQVVAHRLQVMRRLGIIIAHLRSRFFPGKFSPSRISSVRW